MTLVGKNENAPPSPNAPALRPFYMLSTEIISIPTGFIFLCVMGTLWKSRIL